MHTQLATDMMGTKIKSPEGENIGVVQNILIDPDKESIMYLILCYANFVGKNNRVLIVPSQLLRIKITETSTFFLELDKSLLQNVARLTPDIHLQGPTENISCIYELISD